MFKTLGDNTRRQTAGNNGQHRLPYTRENLVGNGTESQGEPDGLIWSTTSSKAVRDKGSNFSNTAKQGAGLEVSDAGVEMRALAVATLSKKCRKLLHVSGDASVHT